MNAQSLLLSHKPEPADFCDTDLHTRPMAWVADPDPEEPPFLFMHRIYITNPRVPADDLHAMDDAEIEDKQVSSFFALDMLCLALIAVLGIFLSIYKPWQWFGPMDLEGAYQAVVAVVTQPWEWF